MSVSHTGGTDTDRDAELDVISALLQVSGGLIDPRRPRRNRHELASVLTITVLTVLAGTRNFRVAYFGQELGLAKRTWMPCPARRAHSAGSAPEADQNEMPAWRRS